MKTSQTCGYCGNVHHKLADTVCPVSSNKNQLPISDGKEKFYSLEIVIPKIKIIRSSAHEMSEFSKYLNDIKDEYQKARYGTFPCYDGRLQNLKNKNI